MIQPNPPVAPPQIPPKILLSVIGLVELVVGISSEALSNPVTPAIDAFGIILVGFGIALGAALLYSKSRLWALVTINAVGIVMVVVAVFQHMSLFGPFLALATYNLTRALLILQSEIVSGE